MSRIHAAQRSRQPTHPTPPTVGWWPWRSNATPQTDKTEATRAEPPQLGKLRRSIEPSEPSGPSRASGPSRPSKSTKRTNPSKPSQCNGGTKRRLFRCAPAHCQRVGTGGLAGPCVAMDGNTRAYMDVLAAGPANPPVPAQRDTGLQSGFCPTVAVAVAVAVAVSVAIAIASSPTFPKSRKKKKPRCQPASRLTSWGRSRITWDAPNHQNMCRPPFTA